MIEVASAAEWDFAANLLGAERVGGVNFAGAETIVDLIDGGTDGAGGVFF